MLSYLPLAHIFDRVMEEAFLAAGAAVGFWRGSLAGLVADIQALRPTHFHGVPRIFERIYTRIQDGVRQSGGIKGFLYNWAFSSKLARLRAGFPSHTSAPTWDALVFNKARHRPSALSTLPSISPSILSRCTRAPPASPPSRQFHCTHTRPASPLRISLRHLGTHHVLAADCLGPA